MKKEIKPNLKSLLYQINMIVLIQKLACVKYFDKLQ